MNLMNFSFFIWVTFSILCATFFIWVTFSYVFCNFYESHLGNFSFFRKTFRPIMLRFENRPPILTWPSINSMLNQKRSMGERLMLTLVWPLSLTLLLLPEVRLGGVQASRHGLNLHLLFHPFGAVGHWHEIRHQTMWHALDLH
jgi:hypothetical protein